MKPLPRRRKVAAALFSGLVTATTLVGVSATPAFAIITSCTDSACPDPTDWADARWDQHSDYPSNGGTVNGANCTNYAAWRLMNNGLAESSLDGLGNASTWDERAAAKGYTVNGSPSVGSIAQWEGNHVAYVEQVNSNGSVVISESNYYFGSDPNDASARTWLHRRVVMTSTVNHFIHFGGAPGLVDTDWRLVNDLFGGAADESYSHGAEGDIPVVGDWNNDGVDTPGVFRNGRWILTDEPGGGDFSHSFIFGQAGDTPVVGDWDGDGVDTPGVHRGAHWYITNAFASGSMEDFVYGNSTDEPVVGDWDGDGIDTIGVHRGASWILTNTHSSADKFTKVYGSSTDTPVVGDWNGDHIDTLGIKRGTLWKLTNTFDSATTIDFTFGRSSDFPLVGDWDNDGNDTIGIAR